MPFGFLLRAGFYGRDHRGSPILLPTRHLSLIEYSIHGSTDVDVGCPLCANKRHMHRSKYLRYSITSSARARSVGGISGPSALAMVGPEPSHLMRCGVLSVNIVLWGASERGGPDMCDYSLHYVRTRPAK